MNIFFLLRTLLIYAVCLPLAIALGYMLATPDDFRSLGLVGLVLMVLSIPIVLRWHYPLLLFSWNCGISVIFLPGKTKLWMALSLISFSISFVGYALNKSNRLQHVPALTWSLLSVGFVTLLTAELRGGIGIRALSGSSFGGAHYFYIFFAIIGYLALSVQIIPTAQALRSTGWYILGALTTAMSNLIYLAGPAFYWLYILFPLDFASGQIAGDEMGGVQRLTGIAYAMSAAYSFLIAKYGIRGIFGAGKPLRILVLFVILFLSLLGGFRSFLVFLILLFAVQFFLEGLFQARSVFPLLVGILLLAVIVIPFSSQLPNTVQRTISFLPVDVDPTIRANTADSNEWRLKMWRAVFPEIPKYLLLGKGYAINPTDIYLVAEASRRGFSPDYEGSLVAGDYHSGPLSVIISFGLLGVLTFSAFCFCCLRFLYQNYRHGNPALQKINTFLLSLFIVRFLMFLGVYGSLSIDLAIFAGIAGFSVALNGDNRGVQPYLQEKPEAKTDSVVREISVAST